jgi:hypothetical protein
LELKERKIIKSPPTIHPLPTPYDQLPVKGKMFVANMIELSKTQEINYINCEV